MAEIGSDSSPLEAQLPIPPVENEEEGKIPEFGALEVR